MKSRDGRVVKFYVGSARGNASPVNNNSAYAATVGVTSLFVQRSPHEAFRWMPQSPTARTSRLENKVRGTDISRSGTVKCHWKEGKKAPRRRPIRNKHENIVGFET